MKFPFHKKQAFSVIRLFYAKTCKDLAKFVLAEFAARQRLAPLTTLSDSIDTGEESRRRNNPLLH